MYRPGYPEPQPTLIGTFDAPSEFALYTHSNAPTSALYFGPNACVYTPIVIPRRMLATAMWWANGSTLSGNTGMGIYTDHPTDHKPDRLLVQTASTAQAGASQMQVADITDTVLVPGVYWLAFTSSVNSSTYQRVTGLLSYRANCRMTQASVSPGSMPATATPVSASSEDNWLHGLATHSVYGG